MSMIQSENALKVKCEEVSRTKAKVGVEHDINKLVKRYKQTGKLPILGQQGIFTDLSKFDGFMEMNNKVCEAVQIFENYPSEIRSRFGNSVQRFSEVMLNLNMPENLKLAEELGFVKLTEVKDEKATAIVDKKEGDK